MAANMHMNDEDAARMLTSLATPTTSTFGHFRQMSLDSPSTSSFPNGSASSANFNNEKSLKVPRPAGRKLNPDFRLFETLLVYDDIILYLTTQHMEPQELFDLYAISRAFYYRVNLRLTSYILSSARRWALLSDSRPSTEMPEPSTRIKRSAAPSWPSVSRSRRTCYEIEHQSAAAQALQACGTEPTPPGLYSAHDITTLLPFCNYLHLCVPDPTHRVIRNQDGSRTTAQGSPRVVPTFRYLAFLLFRAELFQSIIQALLSLGHRLPGPMPSTLCRLSLLLDLPFNKQRLSLLRNEAFFTPTDLYVSVLFFVKVDMAFTDPVDGTGETSLRKLMLGMTDLTPLCRMLERAEGRTLLDVIKLWLQVNYKPPQGRAEEFKGMSIFGVPASSLGMLGVEGWGCRIAGNGNTARPGQIVVDVPENQTPASSSYTPGSVAHVMSQSSQSQSNSQPSISQQQANQQQHAHQHPLQSTTQHSAQQPHHSQAHIQPTASPVATSAIDPSETPPQGPRPSTAHIPADPYARARLLRPDELVLGEAVRRRIPLHQHIIDMMLYGYVDVRTGEDLPMSEEERIAFMKRHGWMAEDEGISNGEGVGEAGVGKDKGGKEAVKGKGKGKKRMHGVKVEDAEVDEDQDAVMADA